MKSRLLGTLAAAACVAAAVLVAFGLFELFARARYFTPEQRAGGASALWSVYEENVFHPGTRTPCAYVERLVPHPYLGSVMSRVPPCGDRLANNLGMIDRGDYPLRRDPSRFTIVLLGGSVASHLAMGNYAGVNWLEDELNARYASPSGKPFRIVAGAIGGWSYPNQLTFLTLYGTGVDAAVAVDGYNEAEKVSNRRPLYATDPGVYLALARPAVLSWAPLLAGVPQLFRRVFSSTPLRWSFLGLYLFENSYRIADPSRFAPSRESTDSFEALFRAPRDWTSEEVDGWNLTAYENYVRLLASSAKTLGLRYAHFVQPMRQLGKTLTEEEQRMRGQANVDRFRSFEGVSRKLAREGLLTASLTEVFRGEKGTIYADDVHCRYEPVGGDNRGYRLMSAAIAGQLARMWGLRARPR